MFCRSISLRLQCFYALLYKHKQAGHSTQTRLVSDCAGLDWSSHKFATLLVPRGWVTWVLEWNYWVLLCLYVSQLVLVGAWVLFLGVGIMSMSVLSYSPTRRLYKFPKLTATRSGTIICPQTCPYFCGVCCVCQNRRERVERERNITAAHPERTVKQQTKKKYQSIQLIDKPKYLYVGKHRRNVDNCIRFPKLVIRKENW